MPNNLGQYDRPRVLGCEPEDGALVVLSSNQLNIATFVHQMGDVCLPSGEQKWQHVMYLLYFWTRHGMLVCFCFQYWCQSSCWLPRDTIT